jgi:hypothetical protein
VRFSCATSAASRSGCKLFIQHAHKSVHVQSVAWLIHYSSVQQGVDATCDSGCRARCSNMHRRPRTGIGLFFHRFNTAWCSRGFQCYLKRQLLWGHLACTHVISQRHSLCTLQIHYNSVQRVSTHHALMAVELVVPGCTQLSPSGIDLSTAIHCSSVQQGISAASSDDDCRALYSACTQLSPRQALACLCDSLQLGAAR